VERAQDNLKQTKEAVQRRAAVLAGQQQVARAEDKLANTRETLAKAEQSVQ